MLIYQIYNKISEYVDLSNIKQNIRNVNLSNKNIISEMLIYQIYNKISEMLIYQI